MNCFLQVARESLEGRTMAFYSVEDAVPFYRTLGFHTRRFRVLVRDFALDHRDFQHIPDDNDDDANADDDTNNGGVDDEEGELENVVGLDKNNKENVKIQINGNVCEKYDSRKENEFNHENITGEKKNKSTNAGKTDGKVCKGKKKKSKSGAGRVVVRWAKDVRFESLLAYDRAVHGSEREAYLRHWVLRAANVALVALDAETQTVTGYASLSFFAGRWDVSPLYADSDHVALCLLKRAAAEVGQGVRVFARIPADSVRGIKLFSALRATTHHRVLYLMADRPLRKAAVCSDKVYSLSTVCYGLK